MIAPKKGLACHGRVTRISNIPEKWGSSSMRRQSVPGLFSEKEAGNEANIYTSTENKIYDNSSSSREIQ